MPPNTPGFILKLHEELLPKLREIKEYIDTQRGNDPQDLTGLRVVQKIIGDLDFIRDWPWIASRTPGLDRRYRQQRVAEHYMVYYFVEEAKKVIYVFEIKHTSQKPPSSNSLKKKKRETEEQ